MISKDSVPCMFEYYPCVRNAVIKLSFGMNLATIVQDIASVHLYV